MSERTCKLEDEFFSAELHPSLSPLSPPLSPFLLLECLSLRVLNAINGLKCHDMGQVCNHFATLLSPYDHTLAEILPIPTEVFKDEYKSTLDIR